MRKSSEKDRRFSLTVLIFSIYSNQSTEKKCSEGPPMERDVCNKTKINNQIIWGQKQNHQKKHRNYIEINEQTELKALK